MLSKKSIIIVSDKKKEMRKLAHYLYNIIGAVGDFDATLWEEKHYKNNEPTLPSSQKIIFVGDVEASKLMMESIDSIDSVEWKYDCLNMRIGWVGNRAVIYVKRKDLSLKEYAEFKELFDNQSKEIKSGSFLATLKLADNWITKQKKGVKVAGFLFLPYVWPVAAYALVKGHIDSKKIMKQQYAYVTNKFIGEFLSDFFGDTK